MNRAEIEAELRAHLAEASGREPEAVDLGEPFEALGLDSVARVELLARLEDAFCVHVPPEDAIHLETGSALVRYLVRQRS
ncbi:MAG: acyl carrier protein [Planctomycetota bacterium]